ncbi:MAG: PD-(D/E)XK nuclease family protein [Nanoarchaeota archaeon]|nr:PD-(D/E)XK nuclease family protein [Nanoarchaeota archaeon]MEC8339897.1 PD-(D/E)XK nuclease family protein [Nanoarchaeota archaeon]
MMQKISHERDANITFDEENHNYFVNKKKIDYSVTEFIHQFFPEFDADQVIDTYYDMWQTNERSPYFGLQKEEIKEQWKANGEEASRLGSKLHKDIERFYNGEDVTNFSKEYAHFEKFHKDYCDLEPLKQEWCIYDEELGIAGSIDALFKLEDDIIIIDWKRSKEIKEQSQEQGFYPLTHLPNANYWHYCLQLNMYKYILEKNYGLKIAGMNIVVMHPNQDTYQVLSIQDLSNEINDLVELRLKELKSS